MLNVDKVDMTSLYNCAAEIVQMYRNELELRKINASGELSRSADFDVLFNENDIAVYFIANAHWYYVERGRKPTGGGAGQHWVDAVGDIERWLTSKIGKGWFVPRADREVPRNPAEVRRVASAIVRKIHGQGFYSPNHQGKHVLRDVLNAAERNGLIDKMVDSVVSAFDKEVNADIERL